MSSLLLEVMVTVDLGGAGQLFLSGLVGSKSDLFLVLVYSIPFLGDEMFLVSCCLFPGSAPGTALGEHLPGCSAHACWGPGHRRPVSDPLFLCFPGEGGLQSLLGNMSHSQLMQLIGPAGLGGLGNTHSLTHYCLLCKGCLRCAFFCF
jgi:hypothetical protein